MRNTMLERAIASKIAAVAAGCATMLTLSGCGGSVTLGGPSAVAQSTLEATVKSKLEAQAGATARSVACAGDLEAKVGATERCVLTGDDASTVGVTVTVYSVSGTNVEFNIKADLHATPAASAISSSPA